MIYIILNNDKDLYFWNPEENKLLSIQHICSFEDVRYELKNSNKRINFNLTNFLILGSIDNSFNIVLFDNINKTTNMLVKLKLFKFLTSKKINELRNVIYKKLKLNKQDFKISVKLIKRISNDYYWDLIVKQVTVLRKLYSEHKIMERLMELGMTLDEQGNEIALLGYNDFSLTKTIMTGRKIEIPIFGNRYKFMNEENFENYLLMTFMRFFVYYHFEPFVIMEPLLNEEN